MVKKQLKKEVIGPNKQHSRNFREELFEFLADVRDGIEAGDEWPREFDVGSPDEDSAIGLRKLFERSGLDITAPGHWQFMLVAVLNAYGKNWTRVFTDWTESEKNRFLRDLVKQRRNEENNRRFNLCDRLHSNEPKKYPAAPESLRIQLQAILREKRNRVAEGTASVEDIELLKLFDG